MDVNASRFFSLLSPSSRSFSSSRWKSLLFMGTLSGAWAAYMEYDLIRLDDNEGEQTYSITGNFKDLGVPGPLFFRQKNSGSVTVPNGGPSVSAYDTVGAPQYIATSPSSGAIVNGNIDSQDLLKVLAKQNLAVDYWDGSSSYVYGYYTAAGGPVPAGTWTDDTVQNAKFILDASAVTDASYSIAVPIEVEGGAYMGVKTSNNTDGMGSGSSKAEVLFSGALTGSGTFAQVGKRGNLVLSTSSPAFTGNIEVDNYINVTALTQMQSLTNPNDYTTNESEAGAKLQMEFNSASSSNILTGVRFDVPLTGYQNAGFWDAKIGVDLAHASAPYIQVKKTGAGSLWAKSKSEFSGGVNISAGELIVASNAVWSAGSAKVDNGPLGQGVVSVASGAKLQLVLYGAGSVSLENSAHLAAGSSLYGSEGIVTNHSTLTLGEGAGGVNFGGGYDGSYANGLVINGQIIPATGTGTYRVNIAAGKVRFNNTKTGALTNTYGGTTHVSGGATLFVDTDTSLGGTGSLTEVHLLGGTGTLDFSDLETAKTIHNSLYSAGTLKFAPTSAKMMTYAGNVYGESSIATVTSTYEVGVNGVLDLTGIVQKNNSQEHLIEKTGLGTLKLSGNNIHSFTKVTEGTLVFNAATQYSSSVQYSPVGLWDLTVESAGIVDTNGQNIYNPISLGGGVIQNTHASVSSSLTTNAPITLTADGSVLKAGAKDLVVQATISPNSGDKSLKIQGTGVGPGFGVVTLQGANTYTGVSVESGTLKLDVAEGVTGSGATAVVTSGAAGTGSIAVSSGAALDLNGKTVSNAALSLTGILKNTGGVDAVLSEPVMVALGAEHAFDLGSQVTVSGQIAAGASGLNLAAGTLLLQGTQDSAYTGQTRVGASGTAELQFTRSGHLAMGGPVSAGDSAANATAADISVLSFGTLTPLGTVATMAHTMNLDGTFKTDHDLALTSWVSTTGTGTFYVQGAGTPALTVSHLTGGGFTKNGTGKLILTGALHDYTGTLSLFGGLTNLTSIGRLSSAATSSMVMGNAAEFDISQAVDGVNPVTVSVATLNPVSRYAQADVGGVMTFTDLEFAATPAHGDDSACRLVLGANSFSVISGESSFGGAVTGTGDLIARGGSSLTLTGSLVGFTGGLSLNPNNGNAAEILLNPTEASWNAQHLLGTGGLGGSGVTIAANKTLGFLAGVATDTTDRTVAVNLLGAGSVKVDLNAADTEINYLNKNTIVFSGRNAFNGLIVDGSAIVRANSETEAVVGDAVTITASPFGSSGVIVNHASATIDINGYHIYNALDLKGTLYSSKISTGGHMHEAVILRGDSAVIRSRALSATGPSLILHKSLGENGTAKLNIHGEGVVEMRRPSSYTGTTQIEEGSTLQFTRDLDIDQNLSAVYGGIGTSSAVCVDGKLDYSSAPTVGGNILHNLTGTMATAELALGASDLKVFQTDARTYAGSVTGSGILEFAKGTGAVSTWGTTFTGDSSDFEGTLKIQPAAGDSTAYTNFTLATNAKLKVAALDVHDNFTIALNTGAELVYQGSGDSVPDVDARFSGAGKLIFKSSASLSSSTLPKGEISMRGDGILHLSTQAGLETPGAGFNISKISVHGTASWSNLSSTGQGVGAKLGLHGQNLAGHYIGDSYISSIPVTMHADITKDGSNNPIPLCPVISNNASGIATIDQLYFEAVDPQIGASYTPMTGVQALANMQAAFWADEGAIRVNKFQSAPGSVYKYGSQDMILGSLGVEEFGNIGLTTLFVDEGRLRFQGVMNSGNLIRLSNDAILSLEHAHRESPKYVKSMISTMDGASSGVLEVRQGWIDFQGSLSGAVALHVYGQGQYFDYEGSEEAEWHNTAMLTLHDKDLQGSAIAFETSMPMTIDGVLEVDFANDHTWVNDISGVGLVKKLGRGNLTLTGAIENFTGAVAVMEGRLIAPANFSPLLEVYTGATWQTDGPSLEGDGGNINGYIINNNGDIVLGNNDVSTQFLTSVNVQQISGRGTISVASDIIARLRVQEQSTFNDLSVAIGRLSLSGSYNSMVTTQNDGGAPSYGFGGMSAVEGGRLLLEPGLAYTFGHITANNGTIQIQGYNIDQDIRIGTLGGAYYQGNLIGQDGNLYIEDLGVLDIGIDKINAEPNNMSLIVNKLFSGAGSKIILRPDAVSQTDDQPLIKVNQLWDMSADHSILVIPGGSIQTAVTLPLVQLMNPMGYASEDDYNLMKARIVSNLKSNGLYRIEEAGFDNEGLLSCVIRSFNLSELLVSPTFKDIPEQYRALGAGILQQGESVNPVTQQIFSLLSSQETAEEMMDILRAISPTGTTPTSVSGLVAPQGRSANNIIRVANRRDTTQGLLQLQGDRSASSSRFVKANLQSELKGADLISGKVARATDPGAQARMQDYQHIGLDGLAFSSETSYAHQTVNTSGEDLGVTQSSWATSVAATYTANTNAVFGAVVTTSKNNQNLNPNPYAKTAYRGDRYNTAGVLGLYQSDSKPWYVSGVATYGQHNYDVERTWTYEVDATTFVPCQATAAYEGYEFYVTAEAGWKFQLNETLVWQPYVGYINSHLSSSAYVENSTNVSDGQPNQYGITAPAQSSDNQTYNVGFETHQLVKMEDVLYQITTRMGWSSQKDAGDTSTYTYAYLFDPEVSYSSEKTNKRYNTFDLSFGIHAQLKDNVFVNTLYTGNYGTSGNTHTLMASVEYHIG